MNQEANGTIKHPIDSLDERAVFYFKPYRRSPKDNVFANYLSRPIAEEKIHSNVAEKDWPEILRIHEDLGHP